MITLGGSIYILPKIINIVTYPKSEKQNEKDRKGIYLNKEKSTSEKGRKDERKKVKEILDSP